MTFLTTAERGNPYTRIDARAVTVALTPPATTSARWCTVPTTSATWPTAYARPSPGDLVLFTDWRGDADERMDGYDVTIAELLCDAAATGRHRQGPDVAVALAEAALQRRAEPSSRRPDRGGRRRVPAGHAGTRRRLAPSEDVRGPRHRPASGRTSRTSAASTCATAAATPPSIAAIRRRSTWPSRTAAPRRGTTSSWRSKGRRSATSRRASGSGGSIRRR